MNAHPPTPYNPRDFPILRALQTELAVLAHARALPPAIAEAWQALAPGAHGGSTKEGRSVMSEGSGGGGDGGGEDEELLPGHRHAVGAGGRGVTPPGKQSATRGQQSDVFWRFK